MSSVVYYTLLGVSVLFLVGGVKKFVNKKDDLTSDQLDIIADALFQVEEVNKVLVKSGEPEMSRSEKIEITVQLAADLIIVAGVSNVKVGLLRKLLSDSLDKNN